MWTEGHISSLDTFVAIVIGDKVLTNEGSSNQPSVA